MENKIAILMADLTGYTALTETHGATSAADLIDTYLKIVETSLADDCVLQERSGDQVMILSSFPDSLLATAITILKNTSRQDNFLQVHGGLHYGEVLKRKDCYFGTAVNLTARIAAKANPGTFWCSSDFSSSLKNHSSIQFQSKGKHRFKNINEEKEIAEIVNETGNTFAIDPVCKMLILDRNKAVPHPEIDHLLFCSGTCLDTFKKSLVLDSAN